MKTLQIIGDSKYGGATYLILKWCEFLIKNNWQVDVLTTDERTKNALAQIPGIHILGSIYIPRDIQIKKDAKAFFSLFRLLRKNAYDVVHTYSATPSVIGRLAARLAGVKRIYHHQAGWTVNEKVGLVGNLIYKPIEYMSVCMSTKSICVSQAVASQARSGGFAPEKKLITICNGIDPEPFLNTSNANIRKTHGLSENDVLIGATGRLAPQKDLKTAIKAFSCLSKELKDASLYFLLAGEGPQMEDLKALAQNLDLTDRMIFLGFYSDIPGFLSDMDIFISSSLWEGLSISIMEAMAAAKPIVATSILPNVELIEHEVTGLLVPPKDPSELANAIKRFVEDPSLRERCAIAAREKLLKDYTIDRMFEETYRLYVE